MYIMNIKNKYSWPIYICDYVYSLGEYLLTTKDMVSRLRRETIQDNFYDEYMKLDETI